MSTLMRVRPTKIELIRLRRRLSTSVRVRKILSERLTILVNEFLVALRESIEKRKGLYDQLLSVYRRSGALIGTYGSSLAPYLREASCKPKTYIGAENIMGVKIKTIVLKYREGQEVETPGLEEFIRASRELVSTILDLARLENAVHELGREIAITKRKTNALQYIIIPKLNNTIKLLQLRFDEREREEKARLKRIKQILSRHGSSWRENS
ncbi:MAG: V-type ATP synthase subunit D [Desulfurococcaceae archaeon]